MVIKPTVTYACEMWILKMQIEWQLPIFKMKILHKIFALNKKADGFWRINTNEELNKLAKRKNTYIQKKITWFRYLESLEELLLTMKIMEWKPIAFRPKGRSKMRWEDDI